MNKTFCAALALSFVLWIPQAAARSDQSFVRTVTQSNLAEVDVGRLANRRGRAEDVREFGQMLVRDHSSVLQQLRRLARRHDLAVPTRQNAEQRAAYRRLSALRGRSFDLAFLRHMVKNHEGSEALFRAQTRERRAVTARFARETLPKLQQHLAHARSLLDEHRSGTTGVRHMYRNDETDRSDDDRDDNSRDRSNDRRDNTEDDSDESDDRGGSGRY
jgi:putative membrane protein